MHQIFLSAFSNSIMIKKEEAKWITFFGALFFGWEEAEERSLTLLSSELLK